MQEISKIPHSLVHRLRIVSRHGEHRQRIGRATRHFAGKPTQLLCGRLGIDHRNLYTFRLTTQRMRYHRTICTKRLSLTQLLLIHRCGRHEQRSRPHRIDIVRNGRDRHFSGKRRIQVKAISAGKQTQCHSSVHGLTDRAHLSALRSSYSHTHQVTGIASVRGLDAGTSYFCIRNSPISAVTGPAVRPPKTPCGYFRTTVTTKRGLSAGIIAE